MDTKDNSGVSQDEQSQKNLTDSENWTLKMKTAFGNRLNGKSPKISFQKYRKKFHKFMGDPYEWKIT